MSSNYPPGTGPNDPRAPWNQDARTYECPDCDGTGIIDLEDGVDERGSGEQPTGPCETCNGSGLLDWDPNEDDEEDWGDNE